MEDARFDGLVRALGRGTSRRGVLGLPASLAILGVGLGILAPEETEGRKGRKRHTHREISERLGPIQHIFGADKAGAPKHHKDRRRSATGHRFECALR